MLYRCIPPKRQLESNRSPAITEVAILCACPWKGRVEAAEFLKVAFPASYVVACEKSGVRWIAVEVFVNHLDDKLTCLGKEVVFQPFEGRAPNQRLGFFRKAATRFSNQVGVARQSSSIKATISPRASVTPRLRAPAGPVFCWRVTLRLNFTAQHSG